MGRLRKTGISQKTCHTDLYSKLSGRKAPDQSPLIPSVFFLDTKMRCSVFILLTGNDQIIMIQSNDRGNKLLKYTALSISLFVSSYSFSQTINDTIHIKEVTINGQQTGSEVKVINNEINSTVLGRYRQKNLADVISENSVIFIKNYGLGGSATISLRGTGASHTILTWNDININSPMPGQADLSLIPSCFVDNIKILYGGSSMINGSGGFGGIVNIETIPEWKKETSLILNPSAGSYGRYNGSLQVRSGDASFQIVTKVYLESSENNFRYLNNEISAQPVLEERRNSQFTQQGYLQEFYLKKENSISSARVWYQSSRRNLPSPIILSHANTGEKQFDESLRTMLSYKTIKGDFKFSSTGALTITRLNYFNRIASIDSRNFSQKFIIKAGMESTTWKNTVLKLTLNNELSAIKSNNYDKSTSRNVFNITSSLENSIGKRLNSILLIREIINNKKLLIPDFNTGLEFKISEGGAHVIKAGFSRNSKVPDLNDLYWIPGGNPELKNEYSIAGEITYTMNSKLSPSLSLEGNISLFRNSIRDMIQWHPGEFSYWSAQNIGNARTMGTETNLGLTLDQDDFITKINLRYSFTSASQVNETVSSKAKQLIYIPENQFNATFLFLYKKLEVSWIADYTSRRFTTTDNSQFLPGYFLNSLKAGYKINVKDSSVNLNFDINNIFNADYQVIAWYPMPRRYYSIGIIFNLTK